MTVAPSKPDGMTVFNSEEVDTKKQPMFFGKPLGVQRYDSFKYPDASTMDCRSYCMAVDIKCRDRVASAFWNFKLQTFSCICDW